MNSSSDEKARDDDALPCAAIVVALKDGGDVLMAPLFPGEQHSYDVRDLTITIRTPALDEVPPEIAALRAELARKDQAINEIRALATNIEWADAHLDREVSPRYQDQPLAQDWARVAKVVEEAGEAIAELIAITGQNPRKGVLSTEEKLLDELADVTLCGIYAIQHFTKDVDRTLAIVYAKAAYHRERIEGPRILSDLSEHQEGERP